MDRWMGIRGTEHSAVNDILRVRLGTSRPVHSYTLRDKILVVVIPPRSGLAESKFPSFYGW